MTKDGGCWACVCARLRACDTALMTSSVLPPVPRWLCENNRLIRVVDGNIHLCERLAASLNRIFDFLSVSATQIVHRYTDERFSLGTVTDHVDPTRRIKFVITDDGSSCSIHFGIYRFRHERATPTNDEDNLIFYRQPVPEHLCAGIWWISHHHFDVSERVRLQRTKVLRRTNFVGKGDILWPFHFEPQLFETAAN